MHSRTDTHNPPTSFHYGTVEGPTSGDRDPATGADNNEIGNEHRQRRLQHGLYLVCLCFSQRIFSLSLTGNCTWGVFGVCVYVCVCHTEEESCMTAGADGETGLFSTRSSAHIRA